MNANFTRFGSPILGQDVNKVYNSIYGVDGEHFVEVLESSPYEIAVISRLIAYSHQKKKDGGE